MITPKFVPLNENLYQYVLAQRSNANDPLLAALQIETENLGEIGRTAINPDQATLLSLLTALIGAKWAVEVGTFTGTSSISIARYLAPGGKLFCFDRDFKYTSIARRYWMKAGVMDRIDLRLGEAQRLVPHFRPSNLLDLVLIDADKESYDLYFETLIPHVRTGGLIIFNNTLLEGKMIDPAARNGAEARSTDQLNRKLAQDTRVQTVLLSMADGMTVCRKVYSPATESRRGAATDTRRVS
jgi:caffeoyl-CoA O-methyltransferase